MNKSMVIGVVAGIAVATAGGVAGYALLGQGGSTDETSVAAEETVAAASPAPAAQPARTASSPAPAPAEECWDEEVAVQAEPRDDKAIAGTAIGAVVGGALAKELGDDNDVVTAAGAAAGAYAGRRAQREYQENNTTTTIERRCAPAGTR
jgi:uncharacterized protein YcfJ